MYSSTCISIKNVQASEDNIKNKYAEDTKVNTISIPRGAQNKKWG